MNVSVSDTLPPPDRGDETDDDDFIDTSDLHIFNSEDEEGIQEELL
jgi:hypothetical protein